MKFSLSFGILLNGSCWALQSAELTAESGEIGVRLAALVNMPLSGWEVSIDEESGASYRFKRNDPSHRLYEQRTIY